MRAIQSEYPASWKDHGSRNKAPASTDGGAIGRRNSYW
jgi:hypothetical protein